MTQRKFQNEQVKSEYEANLTRIQNAITRIQNKMEWESELPKEVNWSDVSSQAHLIYLLEEAAKFANA